MQHQQQGEVSDVADEGASSRIQVVVRVRPVLPHEASRPVAVTCAPDGSSVQVTLPDKRETSKPALAASTRPDAKVYEFDACLPGHTTQVRVSAAACIVCLAAHVHCVCTRVSTSLAVSCTLCCCQAELFDICGATDLVDAAVDGYHVTGVLCGGCCLVGGRRTRVAA
jgi:hypothetical protein